MGKQTKSKKLNSLGKGKVTPIQVAFLVDRYLCDNNFSETRSVFRTEASSLIAKSPVHEAPKSLLSLGELLNEYISLKEQKVMVDEERRRLEQEKLRIESLLQGMQEVMNTFNANAAAPVNPPINPPPKLAPVTAPPSGTGSFSGCPVYKSPNAMPLTSNAIVQHGNLSSNRPLTRKRMVSNIAPPVTTAKRSRSKLPLANLPSSGAGMQSANTTTIQEINPPSVNISSPENQRPGVVKNLFNQSSQSPPTVSSGHNTPPPVVNSPNYKSVTPMVNSSNAHFSDSTTHNVNVTPSNCTIITTERLMVSPCKRMAYMERHCISSSSPVKSALKRTNKRDFVKGRLDFDGSDVTASLDKPAVEPNLTSESDEGDFFDMDLPNLDVFGANFSFSELLVDLDLDLEGANNGSPCQQMLGASTDTLSGSSNESRDCNMGTDHVLSEFSSTATEVLSGTDMHMQGHSGSDGLTTVKSVTKCLRIVSPVKSHTSQDHYNL